jgi:hypothetical protein
MWEFVGCEEASAAFWWLAGSVLQRVLWIKLQILQASNAAGWV